MNKGFLLDLLLLGSSNFELNEGDVAIINNNNLESTKVADGTYMGMGGESMGVL